MGRTHGLRTTYNYGCRCDECKLAQAAYYQQHKARYQQNDKRWREAGNGYVRRPERQVTCVACGDTFATRRSLQRFCSDKCQNARKILSRPTRLCERCGTPFHPTNGAGTQRFCSKRCVPEIKRPKRIHCNIWVKDCDVCGRAFTSRYENAKRCGDECRKIQNRQQALAYYRKAFDALGRTPDRYMESAHRRRARLLSRPYEDGINISYLLERDGGRCQICRKKVNPRKTRPHPKAPTIDHIVPVDLGGAHIKSNVHLACWSCNASKGTSAVGEQLRLVG